MEDYWKPFWVWRTWGGILRSNLWQMICLPLFQPPLNPFPFLWLPHHFSLFFLYRQQMVVPRARFKIKNDRKMHIFNTLLCIVGLRGKIKEERSNNRHAWHFYFIKFKVKMKNKEERSVGGWNLIWLNERGAWHTVKETAPSRSSAGGVVYSTRIFKFNGAVNLYHL